jgi:hypothetical protein
LGVLSAQHLDSGLVVQERSDEATVVGAVHLPHGVDVAVAGRRVDHGVADHG